MPPRLRLFYSSLTLALLLIPATALYRELSGNPDIWWTPLTMASELDDNRDRIEIYARGKPLGARVAAQQLWIRDEAGSRVVTSDEIRLRFNNWDRVRAAHLPLLLAYAVMLGAGAALALVIASGQLAYRGDRKPLAAK